ncbi:uncharacterized protein NEMAJ01_0676 [Nematocida major]|uniref:uncharacterized protein n=1 Tax=Nematocida major TaxID=1912982 RepID=UPI00200815B0|nr:uncharacterized protein NEMAJ01_0676 [Nematocida major]KAH9385780.1 hypothetical protein NEMAJ01_0676 [Nematocida major]
MNAKFYALMLAALLHCALARVSFGEIIEMQSTEIGESTEFINPRGPLCLLRGFLYSEQGYMHNKRFFSPEIETDYKVKPVGDIETTEEHKYTRNAQNDKPYPPAEGPALSAGIAATDYAVEYHRTLIEMFPSVDGHTLSVAVARDDSFFQFLKRMPSNHAHYMLAALVLLSEGVDVPIEATEKEVKLEIGSIKVEENICEKAAQVINFFKENMQKEKLPDTPEAFSTGDFLNTPQFLIQAYVFEYITSKDDALDFAACVHAILTSLPKKDYKDVYSACFVESKAEEDELLHQLRMIQKAMKNLDSFPFTSPSMLPAYTSVHACKRGQTELLEETFSNYVEAGLLALFCCLAHDPAQKKYNADAMLGEAKENEETEALRTFFQLESVSPKTCTTKETMQEWNRVVSGLQSEHIAYARENRNQVRSGIFNMLYVVAEVTGRRKEEEPRIRKLELMLEGCKIDEAYEDVFKKIQMYVKEIFASLSVDKSLRVKFSDFKVCEQGNGQKDMCGNITLKYTDENEVLQQGICLAFSPGDLVVILCPLAVVSFELEDIEAFFSVDGYPKPSTFAECLFSRYKDMWRSKATAPYTSKVIRKIWDATKRLAVSKIPKQPNQLFVLGMALGYRYAREIVEQFTCCAGIAKLIPDSSHTGARLILNLIGSFPLDDYKTQESLLKPLVFLADTVFLRSKIILTAKRFSEFYRDTRMIARLGRYADRNRQEAVGAMMQYFKLYKIGARQPLFLCSALGSFWGVSDVFGPLLSNLTAQHIEKLDELFLDVEPDDMERALDAKALFDLFLFLHCLEDSSSLDGLVRILFRKISQRSFKVYEENKCIIYGSKKMIHAMLAAMEKHQSILFWEINDNENFEKLLCLLHSSMTSDKD